MADQFFGNIVDSPLVTYKDGRRIVATRRKLPIQWVFLRGGNGIVRFPLLSVADPGFDKEAKYLNLKL